MAKIRTYQEMRRLQTFDDRFEYLRLGGGVGWATFGFDRDVNQRFYRSKEWYDIRQHVIYRDNGCDLGVIGYEIHGDLLVHHVNPMSVDDILRHDEWILNPNFLVTTTQKTHNAIHFGKPSPYPKVVMTRLPGDTRLW